MPRLEQREHNGGTDETVSAQNQNPQRHVRAATRPAGATGSLHDPIAHDSDQPFRASSPATAVVTSISVIVKSAMPCTRNGSVST